MVKNNQKRKPRNPLRTWITGEVAKIHGVTRREVNLVMEAKRNNEGIVSSFMNIQEGATTSAMLEAVNILVPFENEQSQKA